MKKIKEKSREMGAGKKKQTKRWKRVGKDRRAESFIDRKSVV